MENKQSSIEQIFSHIKASRNDIKYWNDSMLVDWLLEEENRFKAMHKEEIINSYEDGHLMGSSNLENTGKQHYYETFEGNNE